VGKQSKRGIRRLTYVIIKKVFSKKPKKKYLYCNDRRETAILPTMRMGRGIWEGRGDFEKQ